MARRSSSNEMDRIDKGFAKFIFGSNSFESLFMVSSLKSKLRFQIRFLCFKHVPARDRFEWESIDYRSEIMEILPWFKVFGLFGAQDVEDTCNSRFTITERRLVLLLGTGWISHISTAMFQMLVMMILLWIFNLKLFLFHKKYKVSLLKNSCPYFMSQNNFMFLPFSSCTEACMTWSIM